MVSPERFERSTSAFAGLRSIQLSYGLTSLTDPLSVGQAEPVLPVACPSLLLRGWAGPALSARLRRVGYPARSCGIYPLERGYCIGNPGGSQPCRGLACSPWPGVILPLPMGISPQTPISELGRLGSRLARQLKGMGIVTAGDLLFHLPFRYDD